jgi:hypothetical protein
LRSPIQKKSRSRSLLFPAPPKSRGLSPNRPVQRGALLLSASFALALSLPLPFIDTQTRYSTRMIGSPARIGPGTTIDA